MAVIAWFIELPLPLQVVVGWFALLVLVGVLLGVAQAAGLLPRGWTAERFRALFERRRDDDDR